MTWPHASCPIGGAIWNEFETTGKFDVPLGQVMYDCGIWEVGAEAEAEYDLQGWWMPAVDDSDFDYYAIRQQLSADRLEALQDGDDPTNDERELWREAEATRRFEAGGYYDVRVWLISCQKAGPPHLN